LKSGGLLFAGVSVHPKMKSVFKAGTRNKVVSLAKNELTTAFSVSK